jgi:hypothetical protein
MNNNIDAAKALMGGVCDGPASLLGGQVGFNEQVFWQVVRSRPSRR